MLCRHRTVSDGKMMHSVSTHLQQHTAICNVRQFPLAQVVFGGSALPRTPDISSFPPLSYEFFTALHVPKLFACFHTFQVLSTSDSLPPQTTTLRRTFQSVATTESFHVRDNDQAPFGRSAQRRLTIKFATGFKRSALTSSHSRPFPSSAQLLRILHR